MLGRSTGGKGPRGEELRLDQQTQKVTFLLRNPVRPVNTVFIYVYSKLTFLLIYLERI